MLVFVIDDEPVLLQATARIVREVKQDAEVMTFSRASDALRAVEMEAVKPDIMFCDIQMPGISGLELAFHMKTLCPTTRVVFVTGYSEYAVEAFRLHAQGYIMKPVDPALIREELELVPQPLTFSGDKLVIRCFGQFDVFWKNEPVVFSRRQSKELLAILVDRNGGVVSQDEIAVALWEDNAGMKDAKNRIRVLISDLKSKFRGLGLENLLIRSYDAIAIRRDEVDCDFFRMLDGDVAAINAFMGEYMSQYSWAELTAGKLYYRFMRDNV